MKELESGGERGKRGRGERYKVLALAVCQFASSCRFGLGGSAARKTDVSPSTERDEL